ncbi:hypothetical protein D3C75_529370 [compost metagenome]
MALKITPYHPQIQTIITTAKLLGYEIAKSLNESTTCPDLSIISMSKKNKYVTIYINNKEIELIFERIAQHRTRKIYNHSEIETIYKDVMTFL